MGCREEIVDMGKKCKGFVGHGKLLYEMNEVRSDKALRYKERVESCSADKLFQMWTNTGPEYM